MAEPDISQRIAQLRSSFADIEAVLDTSRLDQEIERLSAEASAPDLWDDPDKAQKVTSALSHRQQEKKTIEELTGRLDDLDVLREMVEEDPDSAEELTRELEALEGLIGDLEVKTLLDGEYDEMPAVVTIRAGAGGVDAADFAEMLLRMYLRFAEDHGYTTRVLDTSYADIHIFIFKRKL